MNDDEQERRERVESICRQAEIEKAVNEITEELKCGTQDRQSATNS